MIEDLSDKDLFALLENYFSKHSSRKLKNLYWNGVGKKERTLIFTNVDGDDLNTHNNPKIVFRTVKVSSIADWDHINEFINKYIFPSLERYQVGCIDIGKLLSHLKTLNLDFSKLDLATNNFGNRFFITTKKDEPVAVHVAVIVRDVRNVFFIKKWYDELQTIDTCRYEEVDVLDDYISSSGLYTTYIDGIKSFFADSLDLPSKTYLKKLKDVKLSVLLFKGDIFRVVIRMTNGNEVIDTCRVYMNFFVKPARKKK